MGRNLHFRAVIEVLGKPKEHVQDSVKQYVDKLEKNDKYEVLKKDFADLKKHEEEDLWSTFAEVEVKADKVEDLIGFCFDYMPSIIELIDPAEVTFRDEEISAFLNDLQARLHQVDMVAKQVKMENDHLKNNMSRLLKNYIQILLTSKGLTAEKLSILTGVNQEKLEDYLDVLIDEGKIDMKEGVYYKVGNGVKNE